MRNFTFVVLLVALLAVLLKRTTSSTVEHSVEDKNAMLLLKRANQHKRTAYSSQSASHDVCTFPEVDKVTIIKGNKLILNSDRQKMIDKIKCAPHAIPVRLPTQWDELPTLTYVSLHRCLGSKPPFSINGYQCKAKTKEQVRVQFVNMFQGGAMSEVTMYNHTDCSYECQKRTCGPNQKFKMDYCDCECMITKADCPANMIFHSSDCTCKCKMPIDCSHFVYKRFSTKTCQCECDQRIKDICTERGLAMDDRYCKCIPKVK